jgi:protein-tyrosine-phosphatase
MAAGFVRALNRPDIRVWSGGSEPRESINAAAVTAMAELGIDISRQIPQRWDASNLHQAPLVRQATPNAVSSSIDLSDAFEALLEFDD